MRVQRGSGSPERKIAIGMICDKSVLGRISSFWDGSLFSSSWANIVGNWCVTYYKSYGKAPKNHIESLYDTWLESGPEKEVAQLVGQFIGSLSAEYERYKKEANPNYVLDIAAKHFTRNRLKKLSEEIETSVSNNDIEDAVKWVNKFRQVEVGATGYVELLKDSSVMQAALTEKFSPPIIKYPQALGNFFADGLARDSFIAFCASEKRGKSRWLLDMAWRGVAQGRKVAFFQAGDLSLNQIALRFMVRAAKRPAKAGVITYPSRLDADTPPQPVLVQRTFLDDMDIADAKAGFDSLVKKNGGDLRLQVNHNRSISILGIEAILDNWIKDGWVADVVVIDYADVLAPVNGTAETRDQINLTWELMRGISQKFHCLLVTATQANAKSYKTKTLDKSNFSEDKRKHAHVTLMVGINQEDEEKKQGIYRLNFLDARELEYSESTCCYSAGCISIGNPAMFSSF